MVLDETRKILNVLKCEYPQSFQGMSKDTMQVKLNVWQKALEPYPYEMIEKAVMKIITTSNNRFAPQVSEIISSVRQEIEPNIEVVANKAWQQVREFLKRMSKDRNIDASKYKALDDVTKEIYTYDQLRSMSESESSEIEYKWKWFIKRYSEIATRRNDRLIADGKVQELIGNTFLQITND